MPLTPKQKLQRMLPPYMGVIVCVLIFATVISWIPLVLIAKRRATKSPMPRVHIFQDMDAQPRFTAQDTSPLFADSRAMRPPVEGAVARGSLRTDDHFYRGYQTDGQLKVVRDADNQPKWIDGYPEQVTVDLAFLKRGQERYDIYCAVCHGKAGYGDGSVHMRVQEINERASFTGKPMPASGWVPPRNLIYTEHVRTQPLGALFNTISNGFNKMPGYASQISVEDRWAIVAYVKALQKSQSIKRSEVAELYKDEDFAEPIAVPTPPKVEPIQVAEDATDQEKLIAQGKQLFQTKICFTCHQVDPNMPAPAGEALKAPKFLGDFWGKERQVHIGIGGPIETVTMDEAYFMESIVNPMAKIVKDSQPGMAPLPTTEEERQALMAYVKSLSKPAN